MYRLLVVDDETFVVESLADWLTSVKEPELDVYKAHSALQALEHLKRVFFDIVVSDIQMPGIDGLTLLKTIRSQWPACQVIFLTGYDEFDYAYQAIQYGAAKFILKNEGDDVLMEAIEECIENIERDARNTERLKEAEADMQFYRPLLRGAFLRSLFTDGFPGQPALCQSFARLGITLDAARPVMLLVGSVDGPQGATPHEEIDLIVREKIGHAICSEPGLAEGRTVIWLMQPLDNADMEQVRITVRGVAESIRRTCQGTLGIEITFVLDAQSTEFADLPARFALLKDTVDRHLSPNSDIALAELPYFEQRSPSGGESHRLIEQLQQYIRDHLDADLSLYALSEKAYLNPSYLSRRFKELTGGNIGEFIADERIRCAQKLLVEGQMRIGDIALRVGYESAAHFSRVFKRQTGVSPNEYRSRRAFRA